MSGTQRKGIFPYPVRMLQRFFLQMALYEKQLGDTRDALDKLGDLIRRKMSENADSEVCF